MCNLGEAIAQQAFEEGYKQGYEFEVWLGKELKTDKSIEQIIEMGIEKGKELGIREDVVPWIKKSIEKRFGVFIFLTKMSMEKDNLTLDEVLALGKLPYREESVVRYYFSRNDELNDSVIEGAKKVFQRMWDNERARAAAHATQGDAKKP